MFKCHPAQFDFNLCIYKSIPAQYVHTESIDFYDKDGFELTPLEITYYRENEIQLTNCLYNLACHKPWIEQTDFSSGVYLDHSMILQRYAFGGDAFEQLREAAKTNPHIVKLMQTKSKWGIDFSVDYITDNEVLDLFHVEIDSYDRDDILSKHEYVTSIITNTDWVDGAKAIRNRRDEWQHLEGHAQSNWKARFFGFDAAEDIRKAI